MKANHGLWTFGNKSAISNNQPETGKVLEMEDSGMGAPEMITSEAVSIRSLGFDERWL
jgi:hypothetical protein